MRVKENEEKRYQERKIVRRKEEKEKRRRYNRTRTGEKCFSQSFIIFYLFLSYTLFFHQRMFTKSSNVARNEGLVESFLADEGDQSICMHDISVTALVDEKENNGLDTSTVSLGRSFSYRRNQSYASSLALSHTVRVGEKIEYTHKYMHICIHTYIQPCMHTYIHTYI